jgi:hypothetical protein
MVLFIVSCTDHIVNNGSELLPGGGDGEEDLIPIVLNLEGLFGDENGAPTYALTDDGEREGTGFENDINDITVFVFNSSNVCEKIMKRVSPISIPIGPELVKTGYKTFITVVNGNGKLPSGWDDLSISYNGLRQMLTEVVTSLPGAPFLMTGETTATLTYKEESAPDEVTVEVKRAVAKIKIFITKSDVVSQTITMKKITLYNGANRVYLLQDPMSGITYNLSSGKTSFTPTDTVPKKTGSTYCELADTFYTYESLCGSDKSKAVYFELEAAVNSPANVRKARVYLAEDVRSPGDTIYNIHRNYWYNVYINIKDPGMDSVYITVKSCPWNVADTQKVEVGGGYQVVDMAMPFKLVKNYTTAEFTAYPTFAAIEKHSKGASWLDLIVTDGYPWKLEFTGGAENTGAKMSADNGATWHEKIVNKGDDAPHRVYIYRPYVENAEPASGPTFSLTVGGELSGGTYGGGTYNGASYTNGKRVRDFVVQPRDTTPVPTNCYILRPRLSGVPLNETHAYIPLEGVYRYWEDYLKNNGDSIPIGAVSAELVWQDRPGVTGNISVVNTSNKRDQAHIYVEAGAVQGNAVVAMNVGGTIYWSFHLWVTEYNPYEVAGQKVYGGVGGAPKNIFMDRNLGALNNKYDADNGAFGLYYQFGRKDPFFRSNTSLGSVFTVMSSSSAIPGSSLFRPLTAIPVTLYNPATFYNVSAAWPLSSEDSCLWNTPGGKKTAFDPCPEGWRIPKQKSAADTDSPWNGLTGGTGGTFTDQSNGRYHADAGYYPYSGDYRGSNPFNENEAYYWTSWSNSATQVKGLWITTGGVSFTSGIPKYYGASVRCVVDLQYLLENTGSGGLFGNSAGGMDEDIIE